MVDDESSFRRRRRRGSDPADGSGDRSDDQSTDDDQTEEPAVELTPWWRSSAPEPAPAAGAGDDSQGRDAGAPVGARAAAVDDDGLADSRHADAGDAADSDGDDSSPEPAPRRRSSFQALVGSGAEPSAKHIVEPRAEPIVEPAQVDGAATPAPATSRPEVPATPESAAPESATSELPAAPQPALFKPRPDVERPWLRRSSGVPVEPAVADSGNDGATDGSTDGSTVSVDDIAQDGASNSSSNSANDSAPFSWSLTPNDQLDPIVHSSSSDAPSSPQPAGSAALTAPAEPTAPPESLRARREPAGTVPAVTVPPVTVPAVTEPADTEPAEAEPTEAEPAELDPGTGEAVADPRGGTDPELPQLPDEPESSESRPAKRGSAGYDTDSLAFLMELEAAAASASAASDADPDSDPDADRATNTTPDTDAKPETGIRGSAADARRGPISAAGLPTSEFNQETFGGLVPPSGVGPTSQERERPERAARTERPERAERRSGRPATPPLPPVVKWVALGLAVVLVLVALFFLGTRLPSLFGSSGSTPAAAATTTTATPTETPSPTPTPTTPPVETVAAIGPVAPGEHKWNALLGGECLEPYTTPWAEKFAVVDCATAHAAQMVFTAPVTSDPAAAYPGEAEIAAEISLWCSAPGVLDSAAAGAYSDLQVQGTYPVSAEQWAEGERNYYCFISRSTGEALTGTLAVAQPAT